MYISNIEGKKDLKKLIAFQIFKIFKYIAFTLKIYNSSFIKIVYNNNKLKNFRNYL